VHCPRDARELRGIDHQVLPSIFRWRTRAGSALALCRRLAPVEVNDALRIHPVHMDAHHVAATSMRLRGIVTTWAAHGMHSFLRAFLYVGRFRGSLALLGERQLARLRRN